MHISVSVDGFQCFCLLISEFDFVAFLILFLFFFIIELEDGPMVVWSLPCNLLILLCDLVLMVSEKSIVLCVLQLKLYNFNLLSLDDVYPPRYPSLIEAF